IVPLATARPLIEGGQLRALAVLGAKRSPALPEVATVAENALPGFEASGWQGYFVPARTPRDIVMTIRREAVKALASADVADGLRASGNEPVGSAPEEFDAKFKADLANFAKIIKDANIPSPD